MALLFMEGFGGQDTNFKWDFGSGAGTSGTVGARTPGNYFGTWPNVGSYNLIKNFTASNKIIVGYGWYTTFDQGPISFYGDSGVTQHITVVRNGGTGLMEIRRGSTGGTLLATGTTQILNSVWNYFEISVTISDTVGEVHVRLNGKTTDEVSFTGDTKNGGTANTIDKIVFSYTNGSTNRNADIYILNDTGPAPNNNFLGDVVVRTLGPIGNGNSSQLLGSDADSVNNYQLVDERPFSSADYVGSSTVGQKDTYAISDLPAGVTTVYGMQVNGWMAKSDATLGQARYVVRSGGTDFGGITRALTTSYIGYYELYETDPATSVAWTVGGINNLESGMEVV